MQEKKASLFWESLKFRKDKSIVLLLHMKIHLSHSQENVMLFKICDFFFCKRSCVFQCPHLIFRLFFLDCMLSFSFTNIITLMYLCLLTQLLREILFLVWSVFWRRHSVLLCPRSFTPIKQLELNKEAHKAVSNKEKCALDREFKKWIAVCMLASHFISLSCFLFMWR